MMENLVYTAPEVEIIEVEVEKGFATSAGPNGGQGENGFPSIGN